MHPNWIVEKLRALTGFSQVLWEWPFFCYFPLLCFGQPVGGRFLARAVLTFARHGPVRVSRSSFGPRLRFDFLDMGDTLI